MRPGQAAPVFAGGWRNAGRTSPRFNEAGAGCPGILVKSCDPPRLEFYASMRPGQAAPVFETWHGDADRVLTRLQ